MIPGVCAQNIGMLNPEARTWVKKCDMVEIGRGAATLEGARKIAREQAS